MLQNLSKCAHLQLGKNQIKNKLFKIKKVNEKAVLLIKIGVRHLK